MSGKRVPSDDLGAVAGTGVGPNSHEAVVSALRDARSALAELRASLQR